VAILANRYRLVLFLVAECARKVLMLDLAGIEHGQDTTVTGAAVFRRRGVSIGDDFRHMRLVTLFAVSNDHFSRMRFVALGALRDLAVNVMAVRTILCGMFALELLELFVLFCVAGKTCVGNFTGKGDVQRRMRVPMTAKTAFKLEMGFPHMALIALGNRLLDRRRMAGMTARTTNILVFSARGCYVSRRSGMAFHAVII